MPATGTQSEVEKQRILLGLLESVGRDGKQSQRRIAAELGVALGLVNAYLKRCINKGLVKVKEVPARRYAYYLTPQGFAEKSRLTVEYMTYSFSYFRQAKSDCAELLAQAEALGFARIALAGKSDLAEIAGICALDSQISIVAVVDPAANGSRFIGLPIVSSFGAIKDEVDAIMVTDLTTTQQTCQAARSHFDFDRVLVPELLRVRMLQHREMQA